MIDRGYGDALRTLLRRFPAVTILGPRQCGKTTFIRHALPGLDATSTSSGRRTRRPLAADPEARLGQLGDGVVLDEAQRLPEIFPVLRGLIDRRRSRKGRFVLLGSASPSLVRGISESLAGRTAFLDLPPFRWDEVEGRRPAGGLATLWLRGGFPDAFLARSDGARHDWMEAYTRPSSSGTCRPWGSTCRPRRCGSSGRCSPTSTAASGTPLSSRRRSGSATTRSTATWTSSSRHSWSGSCAPYFANVGKRLVKSPKVYFRDSGLLHHFLGIRSARQLDTHPARGSSWEAFVVDQLLSAYRRLDPGSQAWFWRTAQGDEVDLLIETGLPARPLRGEAPLDPRSGRGSGPVALHGRSEALARVRRLPRDVSRTR